MDDPNRDLDPGTTDAGMGQTGMTTPPSAASDLARTDAVAGGSGGVADEPLSGESSSGPGQQWITQLQSMIDQLATQAAPVAREVGAKAAELAAVAAQKAGPFAQKAAEATNTAGQRFAERAQQVAADLRHQEGSSGVDGGASGTGSSDLGSMGSGGTTDGTGSAGPTV